MKRIFSGIPASPGIGIGKAVVYREDQLEGWQKMSEDSGEELIRYQAAVRQFCARTEERADNVALTAGPKQAGILRSQAAMSQDPYLNGKIEGKIASGQTAERALTDECGLFIDSFTASEDEVLRLRAADVRDLRDGMLRTLLGLPEVDLSGLAKGTILVADDLSPSLISSLDPQRVAGIVLRSGGRASHCSILARALEIPAVVGVPQGLEHFLEGETLVVDGFHGHVYLDSSEEELEHWTQDREEVRRVRESERMFVGLDTAMGDGRRVRLDVNVGSENDVLRAEEVGYDGVGLFRSEFLFQGRDALPNEEDQFQVYRRMALAMKGRPLTIRTLDSGGDKPLPYLEQPKEENPQLGCRALRLSLREEEMFLAQLRAVLRAGVFGKVRLMLPMVTGLDELRRAKGLVEQAKAQLCREGTPFQREIPLGVMMETPGAVILADLLAEEADFFSIGTNDLTQYIKVADRNNPEVSQWYSYFDPAVLRGVGRVVACAKAAGISVGMCGEAAADPRYLPLLLFWELDELSVLPSSLLSTRKAVSHWTREEACMVARQALVLETEAEVREFLENNKRF